MLSQKRITIIGAGKMGGTLAAALVKGGTVAAERLVATTAHEASALAAQERYGLRAVVGNVEAARSADIVILAVKPQVMGPVLEELQREIRPDQLVISLAAAIPTGFVEAGLAEGVPVIRCMSNTPCQVGEGMSVLCPGRLATDEHMALARAIFAAVGRVAELDNESLMDAVTGLSGSGPAYAFVVIESLAEGGVKVGLPRDLATLLAAQSLLGAARLVLETGEHPAKLKDAVTTPAGTTVDGLMALEDGGLRVALIRAVERATLKSKELQF
jgi:pyrroline-5-carboxylate reductase